MRAAAAAAAFPVLLSRNCPSSFHAPATEVIIFLQPEQSSVGIFEAGTGISKNCSNRYTRILRNVLCMRLLCVHIA